MLFISFYNTKSIENESSPIIPVTFSANVGNTSVAPSDFIVAAKMSGCSQMRIVFRHMVPTLSSHIIAAVTLAIPVMIINETFLSFLGLGLRPPAISWGVLLQEAQNLQSVALAPWLMLPGIAVIVTVIALNILGDGLRDAADPYH